MNPALLGMSSVAAVLLVCLAVINSGGWGVFWWLPLAFLAGLFNVALHMRAAIKRGVVSRSVAKAGLGVGQLPCLRAAPDRVGLARSGNGPSLSLLSNGPKLAFR